MYPSSRATKTFQRAAGIQLFSTSQKKANLLPEHSVLRDTLGRGLARAAQVPAAHGLLSAARDSSKPEIRNLGGAALTQAVLIAVK